MNERSMLFIDGENLLLRFEHMIKSGCIPAPSAIYLQGVYVWHDSLTTSHEARPYRALYYTAQAGDTDKLESIRRSLAETKYYYKVSGASQEASITPKIFKKEKNSNKTKSVDINLTTDLLRHSMNGSIDRAIVVSGDGDYIPVYEEVMRHGVRVTAAALSSGCNPQIKTTVDQFWDLDDMFFCKAIKK